MLAVTLPMRILSTGRLAWCVESFVAVAACAADIYPSPCCGRYDYRQLLLFGKWKCFWEQQARYTLGLLPRSIRILRMNPTDEVLAMLEAGTGVSVARLRTMTEGALMEESQKLLADFLQRDPF